MVQLVNLAHKFSLFSEQWQPKVVAEMNDYQFKVVRIAGDFIWHSHPETDETLMVVEGVLRGLHRVLPMVTSGRPENATISPAVRLSHG